MPPYYPPTGSAGLLRISTGGLLSIAVGGDLPSHTHTLSEITDAGDLAAEDFPGGTNFLRADGTWAAGGGGISLDDVFNLFYPVGRIVEFAANVDPNTAFARGTWVLHGVGRVTVCIDTGQTEFDTVDETGGTKTHTLTTAEIPSHTHTQDAHNHGVTDPGHIHSPVTDGGSVVNNGAGNAFATTNQSGATGTLSVGSATTGLTVNNATAVNQSSGGGGAHNNLQPYIVTYRWERTA